jgi:hypothetical protein
VTDEYINALSHSVWPDDIETIGKCLKVLSTLPYPLDGTLDYWDSNGDLIAKLWFDSSTEQWLVDFGSWK